MVIEVLEMDQVDDSTSTLENICRNEKLVSELQKEKLRKTMKMKVKWKQKETQLNKKKLC